MTQNKLLNKYLDIIKKPFKDKGFYYDVDTAEECVKIADDFAIGFNDWINVNAYKYPTKTTTKELLEIYKKDFYL